MIFVDYLLVAAVIGLIIMWWLKRRTGVILAAVLLAIFSLWAVFDYRWQGGVGGVVGLLVLVGLGIGRLRQREPSPRPPFITGTLVVILGVIAVIPIYLFPVADMPVPSGKHSIGVKDFALVDDARTGIFLDGVDEPRRLLVRVWYPAETTEGYVRRPYLTALEIKTTARSLGTALGAPFLFQYLKHVATNSYVDAPLLSGANMLPTIIYSHGYTSYASQNTALMETLASHGYVVYSVQHSYDAADTVLPDGTVLPIDPDILQSRLEGQEYEPTQDQLDAFIGNTYTARRNGTFKSLATSIEGGQRLAAISAQVWLDDRLFVHDALASGSVPNSSSTTVINKADGSRR
ncbi:MAG: hypothetical protein AAF512_02430 [Pseudomonadota bacterium]